MSNFHDVGRFGNPYRRMWASRRRRLITESLETRHMLASDWQNSLYPQDVNDDANVTPLDALLVINSINLLPTMPVDFTQPIGTNPYLDTNGDSRLSPIDALLVINEINQDIDFFDLGLRLQNDSGSSNTDRITNDLSVRGQFSVPTSGLSSLRARLGRGEVTDLVIDSQGNFLASASAFGAVVDGAHDITFSANDGAGKRSLKRISLTLDTFAPVSSGPSILAADDTGYRNDDEITRLTNPRVTFETELGATVELRLNGSPLFVGSFTAPLILPTSNLIEGAHTLTVRATDVAGNVLNETTRIVVDTTAPIAPTLDIATNSDSAPLGDKTTRFSRATLQGITERNSFVTVDGVSITARSTGNGSFQLPSVPLTVGSNLIRLSVSDPAGNQATAQGTITRIAEPASASSVVQWNQVLLDAIQRDASIPPVATRNMAMVNLAIYDVINAIERTPAFMVGLTAPSIVSMDAAISSAATVVLTYVYPAQAAAFESTNAAALASIPDGNAKTNGITFGRQVADAVIALRATDGWDKFVDYVPNGSIGKWQPTAPMFDLAQSPQWADLRSFGGIDLDGLVPDGPPDLQSQAYADAYNEVKSLGALNSTTRTAEQTQIARFWSDGAGTYTPPGHWNLIATQLASAQDLSVGESARLFAMLSTALSDASIAAWKAKYKYETWRPIDAIRKAANDSNAATSADANWAPFLITPPHPEYVSGHSTYSAAAARILASYFGENTAFSTTSLGLANVTRSYSSFSQAATEAGRSRIYGGIHFEFSNQDGQAMGRSVADAVLARFNQADDVQAPVVVFDGESNAVYKTNPVITGKVLDNLTGVASAVIQLNDGVPIPLTLDATQGFAFQPALALTGTNDGTHTILVTATDNVGLRSDAFRFTFVLDTRVPTLDITAPTANASLSLGDQLVGTVSGTGSAIQSLTYKLGSGPFVTIAYSPTTGAFAQALDLSKLSLGNQTLRVVAKDAAGLETTLDRSIVLAQTIPLSITGHVPPAGASDIGSTFRPQVDFSRPVDKATLTSASFYATDTTGSKLPATIVPSADGSFAWLFLANAMPGSSTITVTVNGDLIRSMDGSRLDADNNGVPGGSFSYSFTTVSLSSLTNTSIKGRVVDPGNDLKMMTRDDILAGPDGALHTADDVFLNPIAGAKVFILGRESQSVLTDANGFFELNNVPAGTIKLAIDGRTATNAPVGIFWPEMVMDLELDAGYVNTVMGSMGSREERTANIDRTEVYLPRLQTSILKSISSTETTTVTADPAASPNLTSDQRANLRLEVVPGSIIGENGQPVTNPRIGISTVPPELVRDMLPPGLLQHTFDLTIQSPDAATFNTPLQMTFPNVFNAVPGTKLNFLSFDHTTGRLVIEGTATVSADGKSVTTDSGTGITKPGWHGLTPPGVNVKGKPEPREEPCGDLFNDLAGVGLGLAQGKAKTAYDALRFGILGLANTAKDLSMDGWSPEGALELAQGIFGVFGDLMGTPRPGQPKPIYMPWGGRDGFIDRFGKTTTDAITKAGNAFEFAGELTGVFVGFFAAKSLGENLAKCGASQLDPEVLDAAALIVKEFIDDVSSRADSLTDVAEDLLGSKLSPYIGAVPTALRSVNQNLVIANPPGERAVENGNPTIVPIKSLLDSRIDTSQSFRESILERIAVGTQTLLQAFDPTYAPFQRYLSGLSAHIEAAESILTKSSVVIDSAVYYAAHDLSALRPLAQGVYRNGDGVEFSAPPNSSIHLQFYSPSTNRFGEVYFITGESGQLSQARYPFSNSLPIVPLIYDNGFDTDNDGISDRAEKATGTRYDLADSNADGISDFAAVQQGLDPLAGRPVVTGVVASLPLRGEAKEVVVVGDIDNIEDQTAYVATGSYGLAIVDASQFNKPTLLGQIDLPGDAVDVAVDASSGLAAVATGSNLSIVDITNPQAPVVMTSIRVNATQVEVNEGIVYAAVGGGLRSYAIRSGTLIQDLSLGLVNITGVAREGSMLYLMDANGTLRAIDISGPTMVSKGSLPMPLGGGGGGLFVGNGIAYVPALRSIFGGYATVDVRNPDNLRLIANSAAAQTSASPNPFLVTNGSGLGVMAVRGGQGVPPSINVYDVRDPAKTNEFVTAFPLQSVPTSVTIAGGIAYVANGGGGLQIVNYRAFDNRGVAPTITISADASSIDIAPNEDGVQVLEGFSVPIRSQIVDDVQVRSVELLVNGNVVSSALSFPFNLESVAPILPDGVTTGEFTVQARATDTGGNSTLSNMIRIQVRPDTAPPIVNFFNVPLQDIDIVKPGVQILDGKPLFARFAASDLGGVSRVELLQNGQVNQTQTSRFGVFGFESILNSGESSRAVTLQIRVTDNAGNSTLSSEVRFELVPDTIAPRIVSINVRDRDVKSVGAYWLNIEFDKDVAPSSLTNDSFKLVTASGHSIAADRIVIPNPRSVQVQYTLPNPGSYNLTIEASLIQDRRGNRLGEVPLVYQFEATNNAILFPRTQIPSGNEPRIVIPVDINGDGKIDLVSSQVDTNNVSVYLGNGDGTFAQPIPYSIGNSSGIIAIKDLNGDGLLDLVMTHFNANNLSVLLGNGDGTFGAATTYSLPDKPSYVEIVDLNSDGLLDLVVTVFRPQGLVAILYGRADGVFVPGETFAVDSYPYGVSIADLNEDGRLDLVVSYLDTVSPTIHIGNDNGTFTATSSIAQGRTPIEVSIKDLNGDGWLDIVTANVRFRDVTVLLGAGDGTFPTSTIYEVGISPHNVVIEDIDGDGRLDLITSNYDSNDVTILYGNGDGTFGSSRNIAVGTGPRFVTLKDLNDDGRPDLVVANWLSDNLSILLNLRNGQALHASFVNPEVTVTQEVSDRKLVAPLIDSARRNWESLGAPIGQLSGITFVIANLPGTQLGYAVGRTIYLDEDAAGWGWFVDQTPDAQEEFERRDSEWTAISHEAYSRIDLLTVIMHEMGHVLGLDDLYGEDLELMSHALRTGVRRLPSANDVDKLFSKHS